MNWLKRLLWTLSLGGLLGAISFAWFAPHILIWYFSPPAEMAISCTPAVQWAIVTYRKVMFTGVLLGAIVAMIFFFAFLSRGKKPANPGNPGAAPGAGTGSPL